MTCSPWASSSLCISAVGISVAALALASWFWTARLQWSFLLALWHTTFMVPKWRLWILWWCWRQFQKHSGVFVLLPCKLTLYASEMCSFVYFLFNTPWSCISISKLGGTATDWDFGCEIQTTSSLDKEGPFWKHMLKRVWLHGRRARNRTTLCGKPVRKNI